MQKGWSMRRASLRKTTRTQGALVLLAGLIIFAGLAVSSASATGATPAETFPMSSTELPLSPGCRFIDTTVPSSVLNHQIVPVPIGNVGAPANLTIHGRLCLPTTGTPKTVMLALHGVTYTNQYWDVGYQPDTYSFARAMTKAGYAVFAPDRLGYGKSSHPLGALVTLDSGAEVVHQLIQQLHAGAIGGAAYPHVILVGHSYGTATSWLESAEYNDADAIIGTGWGSSVQTIPLARFFAGFATYPAALDPKTSSEVGLDPTYLTPPASGRDEDFLYDLSNVDPNMINYDSNVLRDSITVGEGATFLNRFNKIPLGAFPTAQDELSLPLPAVTGNIKIPVFLDDGAKDIFFCGPDTIYCSSSQALQREEAQYFSPTACARAAVTPDAGHDLNLQLNAPFTYNTIRTWADEVLGPDGSRSASYRATCSEFSGANGAGGPAAYGALPTN
jgi:pimeloyl-ACP methyl ester carboxylesterase